MQDLPRRALILSRLRRTRDAIQQGLPIPKQVKLVVTGEAGNVQRVGSRLASSGVEFRESATLDQPLTSATPPARQVQGQVETPPSGTTAPAGEGHEPSVVVDPSAHQPEPRQPAAPPSPGAAHVPTTPPASVEDHVPAGATPTVGEGGHIPARPSGLRSGLKAVGGAAATIGGTIVLAFLAQWINQKLLESQLRDLEPQISAEIEKHAAKIAAFRSRADRVYANVTVGVAQVTVTDLGPDGTVAQVTMPPMAVLKNVWVSGKDIHGERDESIAALGTDAHEYTYSFELDISEEQIGTYRALMMLWKRNEAQIDQHPGDAELHKEEARLRALFIEKLGAYADIEVLDSGMWPEFTPKFK